MQAQNPVSPSLRQAARNWLTASSRPGDQICSCELGRLHPAVLLRRPNLPDPDDERILEVAAYCGAMIVTHNVRHFRAATLLGIEVKRPAELLALIGEIP